METSAQDGNTASTERSDALPGELGLDREKLALERFKAKLDYRKFLWGSVVAAITVAAIPPLFQFATSYLESVRKEQEQKSTQAAAHDKYVADFLQLAMQQDIEERIRLATYFAAVADTTYQAGWQKLRDDLTKLRDSARDSIDKDEKTWDGLTQTDIASGAGRWEIHYLQRHLAWDYGVLNNLLPNHDLVANPRSEQARITSSTLFDTPADLTAAAPCLAASGVKAVGRYYAKSAKGLTPIEARALIAAGIRIMPIYETNPAKAAYFSAAQGTLDGAAALNYAKAVGQPANTDIFFVVDFDAQPADIANGITAYFAALRRFVQSQQGVARTYRIGVYGSGTVIQSLNDAKLVDRTWLSFVTAWRGSDFSGWDIRQTGVATICGRDGDLNEIGESVRVADIAFATTQ